MAEMRTDELNVINPKYDVDTYFGEMDLPREEIRLRILMEHYLEDAIMAWFLFFYLYMDSGIIPDTEKGKMSEEDKDPLTYVDRDYLVDNLYKKCLEAIKKGFPIDSNVEKHLKKISEDIVDTTLENYEIDEDPNDDDPKDEKAEIDETDNLSRRRAREIATDQVNAIGNYEDIEEAKVAGYQYKIWRTKEDDRVRPTHEVMNGKKIGINEVFTVGGYFMRYPMDTELGASEREIIGCRCVLEYSK